MGKSTRKQRKYLSAHFPFLLRWFTKIPNMPEKIYKPFIDFAKFIVKQLIIQGLLKIAQDLLDKILDKINQELSIIEDYDLSEIYQKLLEIIQAIANYISS